MYVSKYAWVFVMDRMKGKVCVVLHTHTHVGMSVEVVFSRT